MATKTKRHSRYAKIHVCLNELGWSEDRYRDTLFGAFGVSSKTMLSLEQLDEYIQLLRLEMVQAGVLDPSEVKWGWGARKYESLKGRPGDYATPRQLRKIEATWREVARNPSDEALQAFIKRQAKVDHIVWLKKDHVEPVLVALEAMQGQTAPPPTEADQNGNRGDDRAPVEPRSTGRSTPNEPRSNEASTQALKDMSQCERLLWWLRHEGEITQMQAQRELGIGRPAARVFDLRQQGYAIDTIEREVNTQFGDTATVAVYRLA